MLEVPAYALRKPWYIILKQTREKNDDTQNEVWQKGLKTFRNVIDLVEELPSKGHYNPSDKELQFNGLLDLTFDSFFRVKKGYVGNFMIILPQLWVEEIKKNSEGDTDYFAELKKAAFNGRVKNPQRSILQDFIHSRLDPDKDKDTSCKKVTFDLAFFICMWAMLIIKDEDERKLIETIYNKILSQFKSNLAPGLGLAEEFEREPLNNLRKRQSAAYSDIPISFNDSRWISYERTDSSGKWGIASSIITIENSNGRGFAQIFFNSKYQNTEIESKGTVSYDSEGEYLLASLVRENSIKKNALPVTPTFFIMKVRDAPGQTAMVGLYVYYSIFFSRYLSKTVIWTKTESSKDQLNRKGFPNDIVSDNKKFNKIDLSIRRYLYHRSDNRLTIPKSGISNLNSMTNASERSSLLSFLDDHLNDIQGDKKMHDILGRYYVCYFSGNLKEAMSGIKFSKKVGDTSDYLVKNIKIDELEILYDEVAVKFHAIFKHSKSVNEIDEYTGDLFRTRDSFQVLLNSKKNRYKASRLIPKDNNIILLSFCHSEWQGGSRAGKAETESKIFEGVISGLRDEGHIPAAFKALVVKDAQEQGLLSLIDLNSTTLNKLSMAIVKYFKSNILGPYIDIRKNES